MDCTPLLTFSHSRWDFVYQRPQHLMSRLARYHDVLFVEQPRRDDGPARLEAFEPVPGVTVLTPHTNVDAPGFHDDQLPLLRPLLGDWLREHRIDDCVAWLYTPMALPLLAELSPRAVIYDCVDEPSVLKDAPRQLRQREAALLKTADLVFAGGPSLFEAKRTQHANVVCLPNAVEAKHYAPRMPVSIVNSRKLEEVVAQTTAAHEKVAVLATRPPRVANKFMTWINAGRRAELYGRELYVNLRVLDKSGAQEILVEEVPAGEAWDAVRDRLRRAASAENVVAMDPDIAALRADLGEELGTL